MRGLVKVSFKQRTVQNWSKIASDWETNLTLWWWAAFVYTNVESFNDETVCSPYLCLYDDLNDAIEVYLYACRSESNTICHYDELHLSIPMCFSRYGQTVSSPYQWRSFCYYSSLSLCFIQWIQHNMSPWCHTNVSLYDQTVCIAIAMSLWWSHWRYSSLSLCFLERIQHNMSLWWTAYVSMT